MGLIKNSSYNIKGLGITIPQAYARLMSVSVDCNGNANAVFNIQQNREDTLEKSPLDKVYVDTKIDKDLPIFEQVYISAKEIVFTDWEDDIIVEDEDDTIGEDVVQD